MLPFSEFGRTGHRSSRVIFGAAALGGMSESRAFKTLDLVASYGVNHIDTAAMYGSSEDHLKPWLANHRAEVFLATKTQERVGSVARAELERSLERMGVDHIDLIQLHNLVEPDEWSTAFSKGGTVEALNQARAEGLVRFIGVTGHGLRIPSMHLRSLAEFDFDAVLFPYNHSLLSIPQYLEDVAAHAKYVVGEILQLKPSRRWPVVAGMTELKGIAVGMNRSPTRTPFNVQFGTCCHNPISFSIPPVMPHCCHSFSKQLKMTSHAHLMKR
jgi:predicted aldo/keto reductase-like oxidoreductase